MATMREIILAQVQPSPGNLQQNKTPLPTSSPVTVVNPVEIGRVKESVRVESLNGKPIIIEPSAPIQVKVIDTFPQELTILATLIAAISGSIFATLGLWLINKQQFEERMKEQRILTTLEMAKEFDSESMWIARATAHKEFVPGDPNDI